LPVFRIPKHPEEVRPESKSKLAADIAQLDSLANLNGALALKAMREATEVELRTKKLALDYLAAEEKYAETHASDNFAHVYRFMDEVNPQSVAACIDRLETWSRMSQASQDEIRETAKQVDQMTDLTPELRAKCEEFLVMPEPWAFEIDFTSPGGYLVYGMVLFDFIRGLRDRGHKVTTKAVGAAYSMAAILLQAGDHRVMTRETWLLLHQSRGFSYGTAGEVFDNAEHTQREMERIVDILAERSAISRNDIYDELIEHRREWWIDSRQALDYGFVDEVV
jgi:hypothetical protein